MGFNVKRPSVYTTDTQNLAGGDAYQNTPEYELIATLATSFLKEGGDFYRSRENTMLRIAALINIVTPEYAAKAIVYARNTLGMRSVTHMAMCELVRRMSVETHNANSDANEKRAESPRWLRRAVRRSIRRVDDATEMLAYYTTTYGKPIPHALLRGIKDSIEQAPGYALAKYRGEGKSWRLLDAVRLTHPTPHGPSEMFKGNAEELAQLSKGTLTSTDEHETWEVALTQAGQTGKDKKDVWTELVLGRTMPHFALLRNLRNIATYAPDMLADAGQHLTNPAIIRRSLVMPFRYATAYKRIVADDAIREHHAQIGEILEEAINISLGNVPQFEGHTLVALDQSGSMHPGFGDRNETTDTSPIWIGSVFAAILAKSLHADLMTFGWEAEYTPYHPGEPTLTLASRLAEANKGGTNFHSIFGAATRAYDRIIILSDEQGWVPMNAAPQHVNYHDARTLQAHGIDPGAPRKSLRDYKHTFGADPHIYSFDLRHYGTGMFPEKKAYVMAGFSGEVFNIMSKLERGPGAFVNEVNSVAL